MKTTDRIVALIHAAEGAAPPVVDSPGELIHDLLVGPKGLTVILTTGRVLPLPMSESQAASMRRTWEVELEQGGQGRQR